MVLTDMYVILSPDPCATEEKEKEKKLPSPAIAVHDALDVLWHDFHNTWDLARIIVALLSFGIFTTALFVHVPTQTMYSQSHAVLTTLASSGGDTITDESPVKFLNIEAIPDILKWLNGTFVPQVFVTADPYDERLPENEWGRIATYNQVLGEVSFEVTQMHKHDCKTEKFLRTVYGDCYDPEDVVVYEFVIPYYYTSTEAAQILEERGSWLNASTKELLITVPALNSEIPGYVVTTLELDFRGGGYIKPSFTTTPMPANLFPNTNTIVLDILVVLWFSPWMLGLTILQYAIKRQQSTDRIWKIIRKCLFPSGWLAIDVLRGPIVHAFYATVFITHLKLTNTDFQQRITDLQDRNSDALAPLIDSLKHIARLSVVMRLLAAAAVFIQGLRVLNTFRNHMGLSVISRSVLKAIRWCGAFSVTLFVVFMTFAVAGTVLFGSHVDEFSSLLISITTCINMVFGEFDFNVIRDVHYAVFFYWSFMALETFVLLNILLAIVVEAYSKERKKKERTKWWTFRRVLANLFRKVAVKIVDHFQSPSRKHSQVVFWGRIRSKKLRCVLESGNSLEWTCDPIVTVERLGQLFPCTSKLERENTMKYLVAGMCHDLGKHSDSTSSDVAVSVSKVKNDTDQVTDSAIISTRTIYDTRSPTSAIQDLTFRLADVELKMEHFNVVLQQKIDLLVEQIQKSHR
ncbi:hypothetical protein PI124_g12554 [Phytophthora idaei]|nr:hypothetical protein PI125_g12090 [Phytophthora idaei]KAG3172287.1 hypothetical protein PI126_g1454 [Phytophthora idaei]KAG3242627.1 hypothetical protein PI124_g12554 [Phytophthora idaei]